MNTRTAACTALLALAALTGCSSGSDSHKPVADPAACEAALEAQYLRAIAEGDPGGLPVYEKRGTPDDCAGLDDGDVNAFAWGIVGKHGIEDLEGAVDEYASRLADPQP